MKVFAVRRNGALMSIKANRSHARLVAIVALAVSLLTLCGCTSSSEDKASPKEEGWVLSKETVRCVRDDGSTWETVTTYEYDQAGNRTSSEEYDDGEFSRRVEWTYDENGRVIFERERMQNLVYRNGESWYETSYAYDDKGDLHSQSTIKGHESWEGNTQLQSDYSYERQRDGENRETYFAQYDQMRGGGLDVEVFTAYTDSGKTESREEVDYKDDGSFSSSKEVYSYDAEGNVTKVEYYEDGVLDSVRVSEYQKDELGTLFSSYSIDEAGRKGDFSSGQLDSDGNVMSLWSEDMSLSYARNDAGDVVESVQSSGSSTTRELYEYDEHGNVVREISSTSSLATYYRSYDYINYRTGATSYGGNVLDIIQVGPYDSSLIALEGSREVESIEGAGSFDGTWYADDNSVALSIDGRTGGYRLMVYESVALGYSNAFWCCGLDAGFASVSGSHLELISEDSTFTVSHEGDELILVLVSGARYGVEEGEYILRRNVSLGSGVLQYGARFETPLYIIEAPDSAGMNLAYGYQPDTYSLGDPEGGPWFAHTTNVFINGSTRGAFFVMASNPGDYEEYGPIPPQGALLCKHIGEIDGWDVWVCASESLCSDAQLEEYSSLVRLASG